MATRTLRRSKKILLSVAAVGSAASIAGLGTYATFTDTTSATHNLDSGTVDINLGAAGSADNRLTIGAAGMVPGDTLQRRVKLTNAGDQALSSLKLSTAAATANLLTVDDVDDTSGLEVKVQKCTGAVGWTESATTPYTYTCDATLAGDNAGVRADVVANQNIIMADLDLGTVNSLTAGGTDDWVVTVSLPSTADNDYQGLATDVTYTFTATQRAATNK